MDGDGDRGKAGASSPAAARGAHRSLVSQPLRAILRIACTYLALALIACGTESPPLRPVLRIRCPDRMVGVPGRARACIDRHEARIERGLAVPATDAPASSELTWFDAESACRRAGLRLCTLEEFERACAGADRTRRFSYGNEHVPRRCNVAEQGDEYASRAIGASGSLPECVSPEGVFDLNGNAMEWLSDEGRGGGLRALRGGSAFQPANSAACILDEAGFLVPDEQAGGFRCCATLDAPP